LKYSRILIIAPILFSAILLAGCANWQVPSEAPTEVETSPSTIPPATPTLHQTSSPTPLITLVANYTPTPKMITPAPSEGTFIDQSINSPDGEWTALPAFETLSTGYRVSLTITNKDKSIVWTPVDYQGDGLGYSFPKPKRWSADSRYFYYLESAVVDGCGDFYSIETNWQRFDVQSGQVDKFDLPAGRGHMFSPDESTLAYIPETAPTDLVLLEVSTQTETRVALPITLEDGQIPQAGGILWSPDGDQIILAAANGNICETKQLEFYLISINISDLEVATLYQGKDFIRSLAWGTNGKVRVMDWNSKSWWIDSTSGEITTAP